MTEKRQKILQEIVAEINETLETTWTATEVLKGKEVDIAGPWRPHIGVLIKKYRTAGWVITRKVEINTSTPRCPRDYLIFLNPTWMVCPKEIRGTGVRR